MNVKEQKETGGSNDDAEARQKAKNVARKKT